MEQFPLTETNLVSSGRYSSQLEQSVSAAVAGVLAQAGQMPPRPTLQTAEGAQYDDTLLQEPSAESGGSVLPDHNGFIVRAMRAATPKQRELRAAYAVGVQAASRRRLYHMEQPKPWAPEVTEMSLSKFGDMPIQEMPRLASPIVEMIREEMPEVVMVADRGGRLLGNAVWGVWHQRYPGVRFPTIDHRMHFGRNSSDPDSKDTELALMHILYRSGAMAEMAGREVEKDKRPLKVLLIDDWVGAGRTARRTREVLERAGNLSGRLRLLMGTMYGTRLDDTVDRHVLGTESAYYDFPWTDNPNAFGVDYPTTHEQYSRVLPEVRRSHQAMELRRSLREAIKERISPSPYPYTGSHAIAPGATQKESAFSRAVSRIKNIFKGLRENG
ncbi:MAG TPA: phosphoribosyltransferase [Candidatus Saccharimonadales bacterium]|nr:phosphoribosyltransferase [Candidatus Saccharimonadales bacterium]